MQQQAKRQPVLKHLRANGANLAYFEWGRPVSGRPTLYFVHATGFHARVWDRIIEMLPDYHVLALEQRGHGRSENLAADHWRTFGEDQAAFVQGLQLEKLIGIGHSMGAHGMIEGACISGAFSSLLLLDPTVAAAADYASRSPGGAFPDAYEGVLHPAAKRRRYFESVQQMVTQIAGKSSFPLFEPRILRDYCEHGLLPCEDGFELACPPEIEARVYMAARSNGEIYDSVVALDIPVTVMRARTPTTGAEADFSSSPTWPGLAAAFPRGQDIHLEHCSHFIPMQEPDLVVAQIQAHIDLWPH